LIHADGRGDGLTKLRGTVNGGNRACR
jgi:hypothetical protein